MKVIVLGPISTVPEGMKQSDHLVQVWENQRRMIRAARELLMLGHAPFCPALDYLYAYGH